MTFYYDVLANAFSLPQLVPAYFQAPLQEVPLGVSANPEHGPMEEEQVIITKYLHNWTFMQNAEENVKLSMESHFAQITESITKCA